jgi:hypothetical protein
VGEGIGFAIATSLAVLGLVAGIDGPGPLALGMMPSTLGVDLGEPVALIALGVGGIVRLTSIPVAQWLVLARPGTFRWVPVDAGAWSVAILWTFAPSPFIDEQSPIVVVAALYVTAGVLMAVTFASLTAGVAGSLFLPGATHRVGREPGREPGD